MKIDEVITNWTLKNGKVFILIKCFFILFVFSNCAKTHTTVSLPIVNIGAEVKNMHQIYLSQFTNDIRYVPEGSNPESILNWNTEILSDFSEKYILDSDGKLCLLYDNVGDFIRQVGAQGRGPGEYMGISNVFLINKKIYIRDFFGDLNEYDLSGTFIQKHKCGITTDKKYRMEDVIMINDSMIFGNVENQTGQESYKALITDKHGDVKNYYKNFIFFNLGDGIDHTKVRGDAILYKFKKNIYFKELLNDTLFLLDNQYRLIPAFIFGFDKFKLPLSERGKSWSQIDFSSYIELLSAFQTENYLIITCDFAKYFSAKRITPETIKLPGIKDYYQWYNNKVVLGIYDKRTNKLVFSLPTSTDNHLFTSGLYNDIDAGPRFLPDKMVNDSTMVMKIRFDYLVEHIESSDFKDNNPKYPESKKRLKLFVDSLRATGFDNPVLMFVTFKK